MDKPKVSIDWKGPGGNVFSVVAKVASTLDDYWMKDKAKEVKKKFVEMVTNNGTYEDIIGMLGNYVELNLEDRK